MIDRLEITHLKCFQQASFPLRPLTVLTGVNGGGKSTVIQALLFARQASAAPQGRALQLNGPFGLHLGAAHELLHPAAPEPEIGVRLHGPQATDSEGWEYRFGVPDGDNTLHLTVETAPSGSVPGVGNPEGRFTYLSAERLGPRDTLSVSAQDPEAIGVGVHGEFTAQVLALRTTWKVLSERNIREELQLAQAGSPSAAKQTEAWVSEIIRPIHISTQLPVGIMASTIRFQETGRDGSEIRPANTGFGVSYALPVIVAGLLTRPGDMLIVENPEAHLHPAAQSRIGRFLARVAGSGVQVIVETHSDHVLNGARLAVAEDRTLPSPDMVVHYFDQDGAVPIQINDKGELDRWPEGFFDQIESDLGRLARAHRRR